MDYRVSERRYAAESWTAYCEGNAAEIKRLLSTVRYFGKASKRGCGFIASWAVEPIAEFSYRDRSGNALRPLPVEGNPTGVRQGWTPPYWLRETWRVCEPSAVARMMS
jgi:CRISPR type IV-associated protein Csf3